MIVLDVRDRERSRSVVHELGALVEERRVVLVRLDDEESATAKARRDPEIGGNPADQEAR